MAANECSVKPESTTKSGSRQLWVIILNISVIDKIRLDRLASTYIEVFNAAPWHEGWSPDTAKQRLSHFLDYPDSLAYQVTDSNGLVTGAVIGNVVPAMGVSDFVMHELFIHPSCQRQGIGTGLLKYLLNELQQRHIASVYVITTRATPAQTFYLQQGFTISDSEINLVLRLDSDTE